MKAQDDIPFQGVSISYYNVTLFLFIMIRIHNNTLVPLAKGLRNNMTREEKHLWYDFLSGYPVRFIRQKIVGNYIVDFYCSRADLVIEIDGSQHYEEEAIEYDKVRTEFLEKYNLYVVRFSNAEIHRDFRGVCRRIDELVKERLR